MVAFLTDISLVFRSFLGNQQIHFECCQFQSGIFITWLFFFFSEIVIFKSLCRPIQSVIILVINKSDSRWAIVRFCYHSYDYRPNWTPLSPITIPNNNNGNDNDNDNDNDNVNKYIF